MISAGFYTFTLTDAWPTVTCTQCGCTFPERKHFPWLKCFNMINKFLNECRNLTQTGLISVSLQSSMSLSGKIWKLLSQASITHNILSQVVITFTTFFIKAPHSSAIIFHQGGNDFLDFLPQCLKAFISHRIKSSGMNYESTERLRNFLKDNCLRTIKRKFIIFPFCNCIPI